MEIYVRKDGEKHGPYSLEQLREHLASGRFAEEDPACFDGRNWVTVEQVTTSSQQEGDGMFGWWQGSMASLIALLLPVVGIAVAMVVGVVRAWLPEEEGMVAGQQVEPETGAKERELPLVVPGVPVEAEGLSADDIGYHKKALENQLKTFGPEHPAVAASYQKLGLEYAKKGEHDKAVENCEKALAIRLKALGPEHLDVAGSYHSLGTTYADKGEREKAKACLLMAKAIRMKGLGPDHPQTKETQVAIDGLK